MQLTIIPRPGLDFLEACRVEGPPLRLGENGLVLEVEVTLLPPADEEDEDRVPMAQIHTRNGGYAEMPVFVFGIFADRGLYDAWFKTSAEGEALTLEFDVEAFDFMPLPDGTSVSKFSGFDGAEVRVKVADPERELEAA